MLCLAFAIAHYFLYDDKKSRQLDALNLALLISVEVTLLISFVLMVDTYRRMKKSFANNQMFKENKTVLHLQLYVVGLHILIEIALATMLDIFFNRISANESSNNTALGLKIL